MAKLVQKSGYIKSGKAGGYMRYIATREGVEKLAGNGAVTKGQRELIQELLHDFPDAVELFEYEDYCKTPTLGTASTFITMALDANLHEIDSESGYMQYANREDLERNLPQSNKAENADMRGAYAVSGRGGIAHEPAVDKPRRRGGKQMKTYGEEDL